MRSDIPTLAEQILRGNAERAEAGLGPSVNLVALGIGNGCSGTESASCGSRPSATTFAETDEGITLRFLRDHALLSAEVFDGVHSACSHVTGANPLSRFRDCYVHVPWDGLTPELIRVCFPAEEAPGFCFRSQKAPRALAKSRAHWGFRSAEHSAPT